MPRTRKDKYKSIMPAQPARPNSNSKQPHIRIEFDDIADTPKVFIDGVDATDWKRNGKALVALHLDWITDDEQLQPKSFKLKTIEQNGYHILNCKYSDTGR
ncbi:hypothetical protein ACW9VY_05445 [Lactiplantibacillus plantarum]